MQQTEGVPFALGAVFRALEDAKQTLGLETYTLSQTTLEQVFLNIAARQKDDNDVAAADYVSVVDNTTATPAMSAARLKVTAEV